MNTRILKLKKKLKFVDKFITKFLHKLYKFCVQNVVFFDNISWVVQQRGYTQTSLILACIFDLWYILIFWVVLCIFFFLLIIINWLRSHMKSFYRRINKIIIFYFIWNVVFKIAWLFFIFKVLFSIFIFLVLYVCYFKTKPRRMYFNHTFLYLDMFLYSFKNIFWDYLSEKVVYILRLKRPLDTFIPMIL